MPFKKNKMSNKHKLDRTLMKVAENSSSDGEESEHELSHYVNDRVKLMKQVLKIIKPKKIKSMAPDCMKNLDNEEINSMLLEELLGISNKRLKYIFTGQNVDEDTSSSTDPEAETKPVDVISLDDVTDDDFVIEIDSSNEESTKLKRQHNIKEEPREKRSKKIKKEKTGKINKKRNSSENKNVKTEEENLMSVLELLELQARARAIKSQLALEASKRSQDIPRDKLKDQKENSNKDDGDDDDAIIIESPKLDEIVITSSESEDNDSNSQAKSHDGLKEKDPLKIGNEQSKKVKIYNTCNIDCHTNQNNKDTGVAEKMSEDSITHCESESNSDKRYVTGGDEIPPSASKELTASEEHENTAMNRVDNESEKLDHQPGNQEGLIISIDDDDMQAIHNE